jgi:hypothetical protein
VARDPSDTRRTVDLALISLVTNLAHEQRNPLLPIHPDVHGIVVVAEKTCECGIYAKEISNDLLLSLSNVPTERFLFPGTRWLTRRLFSFSHPRVRQPWSSLVST